MVKGKLGTDVVQVAGFVVDRQVIGVADSLKGVKENGIDGSFGLGLMDLTFNGKFVDGKGKGARVCARLFSLPAPSYEPIV